MCLCTVHDTLRPSPFIIFQRACSLASMAIHLLGTVSLITTVKNTPLMPYRSLFSCDSWLYFSQTKCFLCWKSDGCCSIYEGAQHLCLCMWQNAGGVGGGEVMYRYFQVMCFSIFSLYVFLLAYRVKHQCGICVVFLDQAVAGCQDDEFVSQMQCQG